MKDDKTVKSDSDIRSSRLLGVRYIMFFVSFLIFLGLYQQVTQAQTITVDMNTTDSNLYNKIYFSNYKMYTSTGSGSDASGNQTQAQHLTSPIIANNDNMDWSKGTITLNIKAGSGLQKGDTLRIAMFRTTFDMTNFDTNKLTTRTDYQSMGSLWDMNTYMAGISNNAHNDNGYLTIPINDANFDPNRDYQVNMTIDVTSHDIGISPWYNSADGKTYVYGANSNYRCTAYTIYFGHDGHKLTLAPITFSGTPYIKPLAEVYSNYQWWSNYGGTNYNISSNWFRSSLRINLGNADSIAKAQQLFKNEDFIQVIRYTNNGASFTNMSVMNNSSLVENGRARSTVRGEGFDSNMVLANNWGGLVTPNLKYGVNSENINRANVDVSSLSGLSISDAVQWGKTHLSGHQFASLHEGNLYTVVVDRGNMRDTISHLSAPIYFPNKSDLDNFIGSQYYSLTADQKTQLDNSLTPQTINGTTVYTFPASGMIDLGLGSITSSDNTVPLNFTLDALDSEGNTGHTSYVKNDTNSNKVEGESALQIKYVDLENKTVLHSQYVYGYLNGKDASGTQKKTADDPDGDGKTNIPNYAMQGYESIAVKDLTSDQKTYLNTLGTPVSVADQYAFLDSSVATPTLVVAMKSKPQFIKIQYWDTDSNKLVSTDTIQGKSGNSGIYSYKIPTNYTYSNITNVSGTSFTGATSKSANYTFDNTDDSSSDNPSQIVRVNLTHTHEVGADNVNRVVTFNYVFTGGTSSRAPSTNNTTIVYKSDKDLITGAETWTPSVTSYTLPVVQGYVVSPTSMSFTSSTSKPSATQAQAVTYTPNTNTITINYLDTNTNKVVKTETVTNKSDSTFTYLVTRPSGYALPDKFNYQNLNSVSYDKVNNRFNISMGVQTTSTINIYVSTIKPMVGYPLTGSISSLIVILAGIFLVYLESDREYRVKRK